MHVLVVTQYFWPEHFRVNDLVLALRERGHDVTVLTGQPNYPGGEIFPEYREASGRFASYHGIPVHRVPNAPRRQGSLRLAWNYLSFVLQASLHGPRLLRQVQPDVIFVFQTSPITSCLPALLIGRLKRAPVVLWTLDLWPDTLSAVGVVRNRVLLRAVGALVGFIYRRCALVLGQSQAFEANVGHYGKGQVPFGYFPQWVETLSAPTPVPTPVPTPMPTPVTADTPVLPNLDGPPGTFTVVFTGNFGEAQDLGTVLDAAARLRHRPEIRWVLVGTGRTEPQLRERLAREGLSACVSMPGAFPPSAMPSFYRAADALLVSLRAEPAFSAVLPGKVQSYLDAGRPILAMLNGEGARVVAESGAGIAVPAGDASALAEAVLALASYPAAEREAMGRRGAQYAAEHFHRARVMDRLESWLVDVARTSQSAR